MISDWVNENILPPVSNFINELIKEEHGYTFMTGGPDAPVNEEKGRVYRGIYRYLIAAAKKKDNVGDTLGHYRYAY